MENSITVALIGGGATVLAALIGVGGVALILWHRRIVIDLCKEVEAYHGHEGWLVEKLLQTARDEAPNEELIRHWRGKYRNASGVEPKPSMTVQQARAIRQRFGSFD